MYGKHLEPYRNQTLVDETYAPNEVFVVRPFFGTFRKNKNQAQILKAEKTQGAIDLVCTQHRGEGGLPKCVHSTQAYAVTMTSFCVQGWRGDQKGPKTCVHTNSILPYSNCDVHL